MSKQPQPFIEPARLEQIRANATFVTEQLAPFADTPFRYDAASVKWLEGFIERQRVRDDFDHDGLVSTLGSWLGEAIAHTTPAARWIDHPEHGLCLVFPNDQACFPFAKVHKQLEKGVEAGESIASFFMIATTILATRDFGQSMLAEQPGRAPGSGRRNTGDGSGGTP